MAGLTGKDAEGTPDVVPAVEPLASKFSPIDPESVGPLFNDLGTFRDAYTSWVGGGRNGPQPRFFDKSGDLSAQHPVASVSEEANVPLPDTQAPPLEKPRSELETRVDEGILGAQAEIQTAIEAIEDETAGVLAVEVHMANFKRDHGKTVSDYLRKKATLAKTEKSPDLLVPESLINKPWGDTDKGEKEKVRRDVLDLARAGLAAEAQTTEPLIEEMNMLETRLQEERKTEGSARQRLDLEMAQRGRADAAFATLREMAQEGMSLDEMTDRIDELDVQVRELEAQLAGSDHNYALRKLNMSEDDATARRWGHRLTQRTRELESLRRDNMPAEGQAQKPQVREEIDTVEAQILQARERYRAAVRTAVERNHELENAQEELGRLRAMEGTLAVENFDPKGSRVGEIALGTIGQMADTLTEAVANSEQTREMPERPDWLTDELVELARDDERPAGNVISEALGALGRGENRHHQIRRIMNLVGRAFSSGQGPVSRGEFEKSAARLRVYSEAGEWQAPRPDVLRDTNTVFGYLHATQDEDPSLDQVEELATRVRLTERERTIGFRDPLNPRDFRYYGAMIWDEFRREGDTPGLMNSAEMVGHLEVLDQDGLRRLRDVAEKIIGAKIVGRLTPRDILPETRIEACRLLDHIDFIENERKNERAKAASISAPRP